MFVIDASLYASIVVRDEFYERARDFLSKARHVRCVTLDLALIEAYNALWRHTYLLKRIPRDRFGALASLLEEVFKWSTSRVYNAADECKRSIELAVEYGMPIYDALYLARRLGFRVATFDLKLLERLKGTDLAALIYVP